MLLLLCVYRRRGNRGGGMWTLSACAAWISTWVQLILRILAFPLPLPPHSLPLSLTFYPPPPPPYLLPSFYQLVILKIGDNWGTWRKDDWTTLIRGRTLSLSLDPLPSLSFSLSMGCVIDTNSNLHYETLCFPKGQAISTLIPIS